VTPAPPCGAPGPATHALQGPAPVPTQPAAAGPLRTMTTPQETSLLLPRLPLARCKPQRMRRRPRRQQLQQRPATLPAATREVQQRLGVLV
jgi:hypothetical protein